MKKMTWMVVCVMMVSVLASGCAKKTASEQLRDDMKKAGNQMKKDLNNF